MTSRKRRQPVDFNVSEEVTPLAPPLKQVDESAPQPWPRGSAAVQPERSRGRRRAKVGSHSDGAFDPPPAWPIYGVAAAVSAVWAAAPIAFAVGYRSQIAPFNDNAFALAVLVLLVLGPAAMVWLAAYMVRQGQRLAAETRRAKSVADEMVWPAIAAGLSAGDVVQAVREEIGLAGGAAEEARKTLIALRQSMAADTERLAQATASSMQSAQGLAEALGRERAEMGALGQTLDAQAAKVAEAIAQQSHMVAQASDLAQTQIREAEAGLAARAADLAAAAGGASDVARAAGDDLNRHVARLETAGMGVTDQIRAIEGGLAEHRSGLVNLAQLLREDHQEFAARAENHAAQLGEFISQARLSAMEMGERTVKGGESLRQIVAEAAEHFRQLIDTVHAERSELGERGAESVAAFAASAQEGRETLIVLRQTLAAEAERLAQAASSSIQTAQGLAEALGRERSEMGALGQVLDAQAVKVAEVIAQQARMVTEASDLAQTQLREAEAALTARAADLTAAAGQVNEMARTAGEGLDRHVAQLQTAGVGVAEQIRAVEGGLTEQRAGLITLTQALRTDHEEFAARADTHASQLTEFISQARLSAVEMGDRAIKGGETLRQLIAEAADQLRQLTEAAQTERAGLGESGAQTLAVFSEAAANERTRLETETRAAIESLARAAEETRAAAGRHAESARHQVEQLSEAAFLAGQKANQVFESRLAEARELIERSSEMVEKTGEATARKLEEGAAAARSTLEELQGMLTEIERRAAELPAAARGQAEQVRAAVTGSMDELMDQAQRAAAETQAIDEAFQERVQRNYQILSEAVRLMGSVAVAGPPQIGDAAAPAPRARSRARAQEAEPEPADTTVPSAKATGSRPRLRLTPTATDDEFSSVFEAAGGRPQEEGQEGDGWSWKELLSSIDKGGGEGDALEAALIKEVAKLGIDPAALLSRDSLDEIAATFQAGDSDAARDLVRSLTQAAIRRVMRSLSADEALRLEVVKNLDLYKGLLDDAAERDQEGFLVATLLGSEAGCAYLVLEAAVHDLP